MSASRSPTRAPCAAQASARLAATVDLPTPPLPDATAMTFLTSVQGFEGALYGVRRDLRLERELDARAVEERRQMRFQGGFAALRHNRRRGTRI